MFDWDNTIRKGFTLFSWLDFLYAEKALSTNVRRKMENVQNQYAAGKITHDDYAKIAGELYAEEMKGISVQSREKLVNKYMKYDCRDIYPFSEEIFSCMNRHDIKAVVISGAPKYILDRYTEKFSLYEIYAFSESFSEGFCNGKVAFNYGVNKKKTVQKLCETYGNRPIIGFGDSSSDIPLFDISTHPFCIVSNTDSNIYKDKPFGKAVNYVDYRITARQMRNLLEKTLKPKRL